MKKIILAALLAVSTITAPQAWAQVPDSVTAIEAPAQVEIIDTLGTYDIGGTQFFIIANRLDSLFTDVRLVAAQVKAQDPQKPMDWVLIVFELFASGVLASFFAQIVKIFNDTKQLVSKLPRGEWIVLVASTIIGGGWLYLETKFVGFEFTDLFFRISGVFMVAVMAWRAGLSRFFDKKETAPAPPPATP